MPIQVRAARPADGTAIRAVARRSWEAAYRDILGTAGIEHGLGRWYSTEALQETISTRPAFVAVHRHTVVGFVFGDVDAGCGEVVALYVDPANSGQGIGTRLLARLRQDLDGRGISTLTANVFSENEAAIAFFRSNGFTERGTETVPITADSTAEMTVLGTSVSPSG